RLNTESWVSQLQHEPVRRCLDALGRTRPLAMYQEDPPLLINTMSSSFKFGCASCHFLRGCKEEINSELHFFQKPRLMFCSNSQRSLWLEVEGSSSGTERRTSPVRK
ncbi:hypothetical protein TNCV_4278511, partial [Trichonephila clavipes]